MAFDGAETLHFWDLNWQFTDEISQLMGVSKLYNMLYPSYHHSYHKLFHGG